MTGVGESTLEGDIFHTLTGIGESTLEVDIFHTLTSVGESTLEGDILLQASTVPHLHRFIVTGAGEEEAVGGHSQLVHPLPVLCKVGYQDALGVPGGLRDRPSAHRPCLGG